MSRIGKRQHKLPSGVDVTLRDDVLTVKGKGGELSFALQPGFTLNSEGGMLTLSIAQSDPRGKLNALYGLYGALLANAIKGVSEGFKRKLNLVGVGYRASMQGKKLVMTLGYSHPVEFETPEGLSVACPDQTTIEISGIDKQLIGQFASEVRASRPPEPYKGKGILYEGEKVRRKAGKTGKK